MERLKGVCVGAGYFSQFHFEAWQRIDHVEIIAIGDAELTKAQKVVDTYAFRKAYDNIERMFVEERPDFVDIITPPDTHLELCRLAVSHGIHIICQKPLAPDMEQAQEIAEMVSGSEVRMMVHENFRFMPWYREIQTLLKKGVIGRRLHSLQLRMRMGDGWQEDAYMNRQPYFREMKQLLMYETGVHFIDVFRFLGGEIAKVYARLNRLNDNIKGEDFAWVQFDFVDGGLGFIDANRYNESTAADARLTFGSLLVDSDRGSIRLYEDGQITIQELGKKEQVHTYSFENKNFAGDCVYHTQRHFTECLLTGRPFETEVTSYLKNIEVLERVYKSHEKGSPLEL